MLIKKINIISDKSKRLWIEVILAITVAILLIISSFIIVLGVNRNKKNENSESIEDLFSLYSYYCESNLTIKSNKNMNIYNMTEYYLKDGDSESIRMDFGKNDNMMTYIISDGVFKIKSNKELNELIISDGYNLNKKNVISISTFLSLFYNVKKIMDEESTNDEIININVVEEGTNKHFNILFNKESRGNNKNLNEIFEEYSEMINVTNGIKKIELIVDKNSNVPIQLLVYNNNLDVYIVVEYSKFIINDKIDKKVFDFLSK